MPARRSSAQVRAAELRELRSRGMRMSARRWASFTPAERRNILRQSRAILRERRPVTPETKRRRVYRTTPWSSVPPQLRRKRDFQRAWLGAYKERPDYQAVKKIQDDLFDFAKREETEEAWMAFREVYDQWSF